MSRDDAPNFRMIRTQKTCSNCKRKSYQSIHRWIYCTKYEFVLPKEGFSSSNLDYYTCDGCEEWGEEE